MAMGTGAKVALGCGCLVLLAGAAIVGTIGVGAFWAKSKVTEMSGGLDRIAAKTDEISRWEKKANAVPYAAPADGVIPEARFVRFLDVRKRVYNVYERFQADIKQLEAKQKARGDKPSFSDALAATGKVASIFGEVRLAQVQALAEVGMNEQEYRDIQLAVYKTAWASETQKQSGKTPSQALNDAGREMRQAMQKGLAEARKQGVAISSAESEDQKLQDSEKEIAEAAKALEVPAPNIALFRKYEGDIRKYAMTGLELIGM